MTFRVFYTRKTGNVPIDIKPGPGKYNKIGRLQLQVTCDATVANRILMITKYVKLPDGSTSAILIGCLATPATANQTGYLSFGPESFARAATTGVWSGNTNGFIGGPPLWAINDEYYRFEVSNGVVGDVFTMTAEMSEGDLRQ